MKPVELIGLKSIVLDFVNNDKRQMAYDILDYFFKKSSSMNEFDVIGELSLKTEYRDLYLRCAERSYAVAYTSEQKFAARTNLIKAYNTMNWPEKALHYTNIQLSIAPNDFDMICQYIANISLCGDKEKAESMIQELIVKFPEKEKELDAMLSGKYLREGQLSRGIQSFIEVFKPRHKIFEEQLKMKRWNGISYPSKTVYVDGEGGIGDEIINIRFFDEIKRRGMNPVLCSPDTKFYKDKNNLFRRHGIEVKTETFSIDNKQFWLPMMSLPATLGLTENDLWKGAYLEPLRQEKNKLDGDKFKIGIKCSGNPYFAQDEYRKIPLELMLSYLPENADIYYIDKLTGHDGTIDLGDRINSWEDTLDFIDQMDCIVSSCTSLVHAAGALGKATFVAVPIAEYYVWTSTRTDTSTPWYGENFNVMKQTKLRDWNEPLSLISEKVKGLMDEKTRDNSKNM